MVFRPASHRQPTLERRRALLRATLEVIAERGIGKTTHRAIAARAGVPLSTTSYFFASIDELISAALAEFTEESIKRMEFITELVSSRRLSPQAAVERFAALLLALPPEQSAGQFELYLEVRRRPELAASARKLLDAYETLAQKALEAAGAPAPREAARALVALSDGFTLQRLLWPRGMEDHRALRDGMTALLRSFGVPFPAAGGEGGPAEPTAGKEKPARRRRRQKGE